MSKGFVINSLEAKKISKHINRHLKNCCHQPVRVEISDNNNGDVSISLITVEGAITLKTEIEHKN